jgi:hypothetical protein
VLHDLVVRYLIVEDFKYLSLSFIVVGHCCIVFSVVIDLDLFVFRRLSDGLNKFLDIIHVCVHLHNSTQTFSLF